MISEKNTVKRIGNQLLFTGPTLLAFISVIIVPFIYGIYMTFFKWYGISSSMPYVGFNNYGAVFHDTKFCPAVWLTIKYVAASVFLINTVVFLLAYLVTMGIRGQIFFRTAFFSPNLLGGLVLRFIWQFMFNNFFTSIGEKFGWELFSKTWLGNETMAFWALVLEIGRAHV